MGNFQKVTKIVYCQLFQKKVKIKLKRPLLHGQIVGIFQMYECESQHECPIAIEDKNKGISSDWKKCPIMNQHH
ncbi:MAG: hypothetical protein JRE64_17770 [Deltaproteobacteria bacterium]|nr:hypothetical protein [Deltaproteobacteria bacterium]